METAQENKRRIGNRLLGHQIWEGDVVVFDPTEARFHAVVAMKERPNHGIDVRLWDWAQVLQRGGRYLVVAKHRQDDDMAIGLLPVPTNGGIVSITPDVRPHWGRVTMCGWTRQQQEEEDNPFRLVGLAIQQFVIQQ